jgi:hypothetical protein
MPFGRTGRMPTPSRGHGTLVPNDLQGILGQDVFDYFAVFDFEPLAAGDFQPA